MTIIEQKFILSVVEDLKIFNGTQFEYFCQGVLSLILSEKGDKADILHKGHNLYAKPVGYTADFITADAEIIGQCGTDADYFTDFDKPIHDIDRVIANHKHCNQIFLFSNQRATGKNHTELVQKIGSKKYSISLIEPYDAELIANVILRNITSTTIILKLMAYLPATFEYYKVLPQTNRLPNFKANYYGRDIDEQNIVNKLKTQDIVQCYGLSGMGKTELTVSIARSLSKSYDSVIWINGDDFTSTIDFNSVKIARLNNFINLAILLENYSILLIADNLNDFVGQFAKDFKSHNKKNSACIVTSLQKNLHDEHSYLIDYLPDVQAKQILLEGFVIPITEEMDSILGHVKGFPLVLRLIKAGVEAQEFSWGDFISELGRITNLTDDKNMLISQRIIGKFKTTLFKELGLIKFINNRIISIHFLKEQLGKIGTNQLIKRAIINQYDPDFFILHQLVLDSIKAEVNITVNVPIYDEYVLKYLEHNNPKKTINYYLFLFNHENMVAEIYKRHADDEPIKRLILYALIQRSDLNANINSLKSDLNALRLNPHHPFDVYLIIEKHEIALAGIDHRKDKNAFDKKCDEIIEDLLQIRDYYVNDPIEVLINHHIGKIYAKQNKFREAESYFKIVVENDAAADYARLQLIRMYIKEKRITEAKQQWEFAFTLSDNFQERSLSILLSLYELLVKDGFEDLRTSYLDNEPEKFMRFIGQAINASFEHPYRVLHSMCKHLSYNLKECYEEICKNLPLPSNINTRHNEELRKAFAAIQLAYYNLLKYSDRPDRLEKMVEASALSEDYWKTVDLTDNYNLKGIIDLYLAVEKYDQALVYAERQDESYFNDQLLSKIHRGLGELDLALKHIDAAVTASVDAKEYHKAAFLNDKAEILHDMGNKDCIVFLKEAITKQNTGRTIQSWNAKLNEWQNVFTTA